MLFSDVFEGRIQLRMFSRVGFRSGIFSKVGSGFILFLNVFYYDADFDSVGKKKYFHLEILNW